MTETARKAPRQNNRKRRPRTESRQRPQTRNPSAPMTSDSPPAATEDEPEAVPTPDGSATAERGTAEQPASGKPPAEKSSAGEPAPTDPTPAPGADDNSPARARRTVREVWPAVRRGAAAGMLRTSRQVRRLPRGSAPAAACVLTGLLAGGAYGMLTPDRYTATSYVAVVPGKEGDPVTALGFAQAYGRIATDTAVLAKAQQEAGVPVAELKGGVEAVTSPDAPMIEITGSASGAEEAAGMANAVARSLTRVAGDSAQDTGVELTAFSRARAPREPSSPSPVLSTAVGGSTGVLVGALVLLVRPRREAQTVPGEQTVPREETVR